LESDKGEEMIWFLWLTIYLNNHQRIEVKYGNFKSKADCEQSMKTLKLRSTNNTITGFIGSCENEKELRRIQEEKK
jgi:hypothetical protein